MGLSRRFKIFQVSVGIIIGLNMPNRSEIVGWLNFCFRFGFGNGLVEPLVEVSEPRESTSLTYPVTQVGCCHLPLAKVGLRCELHLRVAESGFAECSFDLGGIIIGEWTGFGLFDAVETEVEIRTYVFGLLGQVSAFFFSYFGFNLLGYLSEHIGKAVGLVVFPRRLQTVIVNADSKPVVLDAVGFVPEEGVEGTRLEGVGWETRVEFNYHQVQQKQKQIFNQLEHSWLYTFYTSSSWKCSWTKRAADRKLFNCTWWLNSMTSDSMVGFYLSFSLSMVQQRIRILFFSSSWAECTHDRLTQDPSPSTSTYFSPFEVGMNYVRIVVLLRLAITSQFSRSTSMAISSLKSAFLK